MAGDCEVANGRRRRKEQRPVEIAAAALELFSERGYAATRLEDVASRAGVSKGTLFVYYKDKEDLFRAVARTVLTRHPGKLTSLALDTNRPLADLIPVLLHNLATVADTELPSMLRVVLIEAHGFPDLARMWHEEVVSKLLDLLIAAIARAQVRGEVCPGDPRLHAFTIFGPLVSAMMFREVFNTTVAPMPDLRELAATHAEACLKGILQRPGGGSAG